ncbi:MAG TPA: transposase [Thermobifida alba]|uniref:transposase n=1 Tax=Thermobifida cellulosilytica TaxID=144786 RepID=UPI000838C426|nr:transposase [Thermobifida cellulosilytica]HLU99222.1 transposase [Thermobifida alba]
MVDPIRSSENGRELLLDSLWRIVEPRLPAPRTRPQGGGRPRVDDRLLFFVIAEVLDTGRSWKKVATRAGVSAATAHRRYVEWCASGLWQALPGAAAAEFGESPETWFTERLCEQARLRMTG